MPTSARDRRVWGGRSAWLAAAVAASALVTAGLWWLGVPGFFLFLAFPFFWWPQARVWRTCPDCGFEARSEEVRFCPRDGKPL